MQRRSFPHAAAAAFPEQAEEVHVLRAELLYVFIRYVS
jgi:hypothetical protein